MLNKDRYNFDQRFQVLADKVLTFNGIIPSNLGEPPPAKPHDFESYQLQNDPDYAQYKNSNFYTGVPSNPNPYQNFQIPQQQLAANNSMNNKQANNSSFISQVNSPSKLNKTISQGNLFMTKAIPDEIQPFIPSSYGRKARRKSNLDDSDDEDNKRSKQQITAEMILMSNQKMFEMLHAQQNQFQQQFYMQQQIAEAERQRKKHKKREEEQLTETIKPILQNQQKMLDNILQKMQHKPKKPQENQFTQQMSQILVKEMENRRILQEQQQAIEMQRLQQERYNQDSHIQLAAMMLGGFQMPLGQAGYPSPMGQTGYPPQMPMGQTGYPQMPQNMFPGTNSPGGSPGMRGLPNFKSMQQSMFAPQKDPRDQVIQSLLNDIYK